MFALFKKSWNGDASLAAAFWLVYFIGSIVLGIILALIFSFFVPQFASPEVLAQYSPIIKSILFPYTLFSAICVWRCANNAWVFWKILARVVVLLAVLLGVFYILQVLHFV